MLLLQTVFGSAMTKSSDVYYNFPSFRLSFAEGNQTTDNKYDSGIYIMMQMKCYSDKWFEGVCFKKKFRMTPNHVMIITIS